MSAGIPKIISYSKIHPVPGKTIVVNEKDTLDGFPIKRIYWINFDAGEDAFSSHAHKSLHQVIIAVSGEIGIRLENTQGETFDFHLNDPAQGLYIPPLHWKQIQYSQPCILLCLVSEEYDESDYIRNYEAFKAS